MAALTDLDIDRVAVARNVIDPVFLDSPQYEDTQLNAALGRHALVKLETGNPIRSFKGRGVGFALRDVPRGTRVVCASSGNFGQAVAYVGRARGLRVSVFTTTTVNAAKRARMEALGAEIVTVGPDFAEARSAVVSYTRANPGTHLITDGTIPDLAEGAATIAEEITRAGGFDSIVVPVGDGSLISGIGLWMREHSPGTAVIGVNPASAPTMQRSLLAERPVTVDVRGTFTEGISVPRPHAESLRRVRALVDDIVLVDDDQILNAMALIARHLSVIPEPSGAAGLAAIASGLVPGGRVATIVTGANPSPTALAALAHRVAERHDPSPVLAAVKRGSA
jgi:threonine dehydratase